MHPLEWNVHSFSVGVAWCINRFVPLLFTSNTDRQLWYRETRRRRHAGWLRLWLVVICDAADRSWFQCWELQLSRHIVIQLAKRNRVHFQKGPDIVNSWCRHGCTMTDHDIDHWCACTLLPTIGKKHVVKSFCVWTDTYLEKMCSSMFVEKNMNGKQLITTFSFLVIWISPSSQAVARSLRPSHHRCDVASCRKPSQAVASRSEREKSSSITSTSHHHRPSSIAISLYCIVVHVHDHDAFRIDI